MLARKFILKFPHERNSKPQNSISKESQNDHLHGRDRRYPPQRSIHQALSRAKENRPILPPLRRDPAPL